MSLTTTPLVTQKIPKISPLQLITKHNFQPSDSGSPTLQSNNLARASSVKKLYIKLPDSPTHNSHTDDPSPRNNRATTNNQRKLDPLERIRKMLKNTKRSPEEALLLYKYLSNTKFFKNFRENNSELHETDALIHICQYLGYEQSSTAKVIFQEGDQPNGKMYIVFKGEAHVMARRAGHHPRPQRQNSTKAQEKAPLKQTELSRHSSEKTLSPNSKTPRKRFTYSRTVSFDPSPVNLGNSPAQRIDLFNHQNPFKINFDGGSISEENSPLLEPNSPKSPKSPKGALVKLQKVPDDNGPSTITNEPTTKIFKTISSKIISSIREIPQVGGRMSPQLSPPKTIEDILDDEEEQFQKFADRYGTVINKLKDGDFFGELALSSSQRRTASVVTASHCEFITISDELYSYIKKRYEKTNTKKFNFIMDYFPGINPDQNKGFAHDLLYLSQETPCEINSYITTQDQPCKTFYILYEGVCNLYLKMSDDPLYKKLQHYGNQGDQNKNDGILVCKLQPGMFIGEEILFNSTGKSEFTVKAATSDVLLLALNPLEIKTRLPRSTIRAIEEAYLFKHNHHFSHATERTKLKNNIMPLIKPSLQKKFGITSVGTLKSLSSITADTLTKPAFALTPLETNERKDQINQYLRLGNLRSPPNSSANLPGSLSNVVRTLDTVRSRQDFPLSSRIFEEPNPDSKWQFGDDERMPFKVQRMKKKSEGEGKLFKKPVPPPPGSSGQKTIPALKLTTGETLERQVITARLVTRIGKSKTRSEKKKWQKLSIPSSLGLGLSKNTIDLRQTVQTATFTEESDFMDSGRYHHGGAFTERSVINKAHYRNSSGQKDLGIPQLSMIRHENSLEDGLSTLVNLDSLNHLENSSTKPKSKFNLNLKNESILSGFGGVPLESKRKICLKSSTNLSKLKTPAVPLEACFLMGLK